MQDLLQELVKSGQIKARTKWKQIYQTLSADERYLNMLGVPGSNPLELFWDAVDELDQRLDAKMQVAEAAVRAHNARRSGEEDVKEFVVRSETSIEDFVAVVKEDPEAKRLTDKDLREIFYTASILTFSDYARICTDSSVFCRCKRILRRSRKTRSVVWSASSGTCKMTSGMR